NAELLEKKYDRLLEKQKTHQAERYRTRLEVTADISSDDDRPFGLANSKAVFDIAGKCKLVADMKTDPAEGISDTELSLLLEKNPIIGADIYGKKDKLYFDLPVLAPDRFFSLDSDKLAGVYERFDLPVRPVRLPTLDERLNSLKYRSGDAATAAKALGAVLAGYIGKDSVTFGEKVEIEVAGKKIEGRQINVSLGAEESFALIKGLSDKVLSDENLLSLSLGNLAAYSGLAADTGLFQVIEYLEKSGGLVLEEKEVALLKAAESGRDLESLKALFLELLPESSDQMPEGLKMTVVIDGKGNIVDRRIAAKVARVPTANENAEKVTPASDLIDRELIFHSSATEAEIADAVDGSLEFGWYAIKNGEAAEAATSPAKTLPLIKLDYTSKIDTETKKRKDTINYSLAWDNTEGGQDSVSGTVSTLSWKNNKLRTENSSTEISIDMRLKSFGASATKADIRLTREEKLGIEPFTIPSPDSKKNLDLYQASDAEISSAEMELMASLGVFYMTNQSTVDVFLGK
ncbi:MAG: hypothetical protein HGA22_08230, partial [Clostridiales bacterium]|nr:hypothetical protein [Clostridiales bacterium]